MSVAMSNPQRKKERTDAGTYKREVHVSNLPKSMSKKELDELFTQVCWYLYCIIVDHAESLPSVVRSAISASLWMTRGRPRGPHSWSMKMRYVYISFSSLTFDSWVSISTGLRCCCSTQVPQHGSEEA